MLIPSRLVARTVRWLPVVLTMLGGFAAATPASAAEANAALDSLPGLQPIDWFLVVLYALSAIGLGVYYSRAQSTSEYFVGSGAMSPVLIGVSLFATLLSTISI